jgi:hypothetical protein
MKHNKYLLNSIKLINKLCNLINHNSAQGRRKLKTYPFYSIFMHNIQADHRFVYPVIYTGGLLSALIFSWLLSAVIFMEGLLHAPSFSREGLWLPCHFGREGNCMPCHFYGRAFVCLVISEGRAFVRPVKHSEGRAFVRPVIFTGGL